METAKPEKQIVSNSSLFTIEESQAIDRYRKAGMHWIDMEEFFPGRTASQIERHYYKVIRKQVSKSNPVRRLKPLTDAELAERIANAHLFRDPNRKLNENSEEYSYDRE